MAGSFFFYDLETTGINPREGRIMQFAGQRTDMELQPVGKPVNLLIKLTPEVVPEPDAIMVTGITPQSTLADGVTEAEFLQIFYDEVVQAGTIFLGFNTVRFDDEFMRFLHYRNFYDPYEWQWTDACSRWDLLDVVRMTRALRPDGITWPFTAEGYPTNRLELLTKLNGLDHTHAHDALNDVWATIAVAKLIRGKQPKLFDYLLSIRRKKDVVSIVKTGQVFTYSCGKYPKETLHTTAAVLLAENPGEANRDSFMVYDLRHDPTPFLDMSVDQLIDAWQWSREPDKLRLPVKTLKANHCPAVTPGFPKDAVTQQRLQLTTETITRNLRLLNKHKPALVAKLLLAVTKMDAERDSKYRVEPKDCDSQLYDSLPSQADKPVAAAIRDSPPADIMQYADKLRDARLKQLLPRYKARNYPKSLSEEERQTWDNFVRQRLVGGGANPARDSQLAKFFKRIDEIAQRSGLTTDQQYALEELHLYGESIMPVMDEADAETTLA